MDEARCARCDLPVGQCEHTRPARIRRVSVHNEILISPQSMAHLPDCHHNDPKDFPRNWGRITGDPGAWERIGNGFPVEANGGANRGLVAKGRCSDCVARG